MKEDMICKVGLLKIKRYQRGRLEAIMSDVVT